MSARKPDGSDVPPQTDVIRSADQPGSGRDGIMDWFLTNRVAADLLMLALMIGGLLAMSQIQIAVFPTISPNTITVDVVYPGATPSEVEEGVSRRVEEAVTGIEGIKRIRSSAIEGSATVTIELEDDAEDRDVLDDVKSAVDQIADFPPEDAEEPQVALTDAVNPVLSVALYGDVPERTLRELAFQLRDDLIATGEVSNISIAGAREYEIAVEIREPDLRKYGLSFDEVSAAVRGFSVNLPGGAIRSRDGDILLRTDSQAYDRTEFEALVLRTSPDGSLLRLRDVASIVDGFEDVDQRTIFNGQRAMFLDVSRVGSQQALDIEALVKTMMAKAPLPAGVSADVWENRGDILRSRINLLVRNALLGLVLVFGCLVLFLDMKLAFWTTMGIPIAFLGSFIVLPAFGGSINMISLFAFILVLGLVVDDAIVVGENIFAKREAGLQPHEAARRGVREVIGPVVIAVLTTMAAFAPLYFTPGFIGDVLWIVPVVAISVLLMSLVDVFLILPAHLSHGSAAGRRGLLPWIQNWLRERLEWLIERVYTPTLNVLFRWRYVTVSAAAMVFVVMIGMFVGGRIPVVFFPTIGADTIVANLEMNNGTPFERTDEAIRRILLAASQTGDAFDSEIPSALRDDVESLFVNISASVGSQAASESGPPGGGGRSATNIGQVTIELLEGEQRWVSAQEVTDRWRRQIGEIPGMRSLTFQNALLDAGDDVSVELAHADDAQLLRAVNELKVHLGTYAGVVDIADTADLGNREFRFSLTPEGIASGLTLESLARQVRQAYEGDESQRIQRGRDDVRVLVRYDRNTREQVGSIEEMRLLLPGGQRAPLDTVARIEESRGYASIDRTDRRRVLSVTADVLQEQGSATQINNSLRDDFLPRLARDLPGLAYTFEGADREQQESMQGLMVGMGIALLGIFALIAVQLRSYIQPLLIMSVIPLGIVGAIAAHLLLGFQVSFFSFFGIISLAGVMVNDSLVLMDLRNRLLNEGLDPWQATIQASRQRFRPILFTTLTTCLGLAPMIMETSLQAQFLIPVAISLAGGVAFATVVTLMILPSLALIAEDLRAVAGRVFGGERAHRHRPVPRFT